MITDITLHSFFESLEDSEKLELFANYIPEEIPTSFDNDADISSLLDKLINKYSDEYNAFINCLTKEIDQLTEI